MVLTRKRTGIVEIEEKRRFRTVKRREQVDVYTAPTGENKTVFAKIAQIAAGLPDVHPTHTHWTPDGSYRFVSERETPTEVGYDFLIGLLTGLARDGIGGAHTNHVMSRFHSILKEIGEEVGEIRGLDEIRPLEDITYRGKGKGIKVPRFKEFLQKHREKVIEEMTDAIYTAYRMRGKIIDKKEIRKAVENAIEISDKLAHNIFDNRADPYWIAVNHYKNLHKQPPAVQLTGVFDGLLRVPREKVLETIGDNIIEMKKALPNVVKPEEVYGDLWYEFLKKKGIDPSELNPEKKKSKTTAPSQSLILAARELLGLLSGLRLAGYSENALENLRRELERRIDGLIENPKENFELIGLYTTILKLTERGETEKAERLLKEL